MANFKAGDVVQLKSSSGVKDLMDIEKVDESAQIASCVWLDPKKKNQLKGDFLFINLKHYKNPAGVMKFR